MNVPFFEYELVPENPPAEFKPYRAPAYRLSLVRESSIPVTASMHTSRDIYDFVKNLGSDLDREAFFVVCLNTKNKIIGVNMVSLGSLTTSVVHPREVFKIAILTNSSAIILVHNHPSGDPRPSKEDVDCTHRLAAAGAIVGIRVLDHIVVGEEEYYSFADSGMMHP